MDSKHIPTSRTLSWLLRHGATEAGVPMDPAGWVLVADALAHLRISRALLDELVRTNPKQRLALDGDRVRCVQGHSFAVPVTREALEASWVEVPGDATIWHGTQLDALPGIHAEGLVPQRRTHVHLTESPDSAVGIRSKVHVVLAVSPARLRDAGVDVFQAPNGVILARRVPRDCIVGIAPRTRRAEKAASLLYGQFGKALPG